MKWGKKIGKLHFKVYKWVAHLSVSGLHGDLWVQCCDCVFFCSIFSFNIIKPFSLFTCTHTIYTYTHIYICKHTHVYIYMRHTIQGRRHWRKSSCVNLEFRIRSKAKVPVQRLSHKRQSIQLDQGQTGLPNYGSQPVKCPLKNSVLLECVSWQGSCFLAVGLCPLLSILLRMISTHCEFHFKTPAFKRDASLSM